MCRPPGKPMGSASTLPSHHPDGVMEEGQLPNVTETRDLGTIECVCGTPACCVVPSSCIPECCCTVKTKQPAQCHQEMQAARGCAAPQSCLHAPPSTLHAPQAQIKTTHLYPQVLIGLNRQVVSPTQPTSIQRAAQQSVHAHTLNKATGRTHTWSGSACRLHSKQAFSQGS